MAFIKQAKKKCSEINKCTDLYDDAGFSSQKCKQEEGDWWGCSTKEEGHDGLYTCDEIPQGCF